MSVISDIDRGILPFLPWTVRETEAEEPLLEKYDFKYLNKEELRSAIKQAKEDVAHQRNVWEWQELTNLMSGMKITSPSNKNADSISGAVKREKNNTCKKMYKLSGIRHTALSRTRLERKTDSTVTVVKKTVVSTQRVHNVSGDMEKIRTNVSNLSKLLVEVQNILKAPTIDLEILDEEERCRLEKRNAAFDSNFQKRLYDIQRLLSCLMIQGHFTNESRAASVKQMAIILQRSHKALQILYHHLQVGSSSKLSDFVALLRTQLQLCSRLKVKGMNLAAVNQDLDNLQDLVLQVTLQKFLRRERPADQDGVSMKLAHVAEQRFIRHRNAVVGIGNAEKTFSKLKNSHGHIMKQRNRQKSKQTPVDQKCIQKNHQQNLLQRSVKHDSQKVLRGGHNQHQLTNLERRILVTTEYIIQRELEPVVAEIQQLHSTLSHLKQEEVKLSTRKKSTLLKEEKYDPLHSNLVRKLEDRLVELEKVEIEIKGRLNNSFVLDCGDKLRDSGTFQKRALDVAKTMKVTVPCETEEKEDQAFKPLSELTMDNRTLITYGDSAISLITLPSFRLNRVLQYRHEFITYLKSISCYPQDDFNPWRTVDSLCDQILDNVIHSVGKEMKIAAASQSVLNAEISDFLSRF